MALIDLIPQASGNNLAQFVTWVKDGISYIGMSPPTICRRPGLDNSQVWKPLVWGQIERNSEQGVAGNIFCNNRCVCTDLCFVLNSILHNVLNSWQLQWQSALFSSQTQFWRFLKPTKRQHTGIIKMLGGCQRESEDKGQIRSWSVRKRKLRRNSACVGAGALSFRRQVGLLNPWLQSGEKIKQCACSPSGSRWGHQPWHYFRCCSLNSQSWEKIMDNWNGGSALHWFAADGNCQTIRESVKNLFTATVRKWGWEFRKKGFCFDTLP